MFAFYNCFHHKCNFIQCDVFQYFGELWRLESTLHWPRNPWKLWKFSYFWSETMEHQTVWREIHLPLNSTVTIDVHDLISGYYLEKAIFKWVVLTLQDIYNDLYGFTQEEKAIAYKIRQIMRKYGDFCSTLKAFSDQNNPKKVRFPSKIKICTSVCDREVDFCLELKKVRKSDLCNST